MSLSVNSSSKNSETENLLYNTYTSTREGRPKSSSMGLSLPTTLPKPHLVSTITECAKDSLEYSTVFFETQVTGQSHPDVLGNVANCGDVFSPSIQVSDEDESISLTDNHFQNQPVSPPDRSNSVDIINGLALSSLPSPGKPSVPTVSKLTDSKKQIHEIFSLSPPNLSGFRQLPARRSDLSSSRVDTLSLEQKQIIELSVATSMEILKTKIKDVETLKNLLGSTEIIFNGLPHYDIQSITGLLQFGTRDFLGFSTSETHSLDFEKEFYQNAVQLALVYYSRANLEETLLKLGESLPTEGKIQETILNFFKSSLN